MLQASGLPRLVNKTAKHSTEPRPVLDTRRKGGTVETVPPVRL